MYMAFTEEQAMQIRKTGLSVVQFKYCIRNQIDIWWYKLRRIVDSINKIVNSAFEVINDFMDDIKLALEDVRNTNGYPTTIRYKFVKYLSKLGYDKHKMWVATRHTWLARSNCWEDKQ